MKAFRVTSPQGGGKWVETEVPEVHGSKVLVKVAGVGLCHTDLSIMGAPDAFASSYPFTVGHEVSGWVQSLGPQATGVEVGQPVLIYISWGCGRCEQCRHGGYHWCADGATLAGFGPDGGLAEYQVVPDARYLVPLPAGLDVVRAAPLVDAGLTAYHAVQRSRDRLRSVGSTVVVIGAGGLGHMAIQYARLLTPAQVIAIDVSEEKLEFARNHGAHDALLNTTDVATRVRAETGGRGADVILDFVGSNGSLETAASMAAMAGDITLIGGAGGVLPVGHGTVPREVSVTRTGMGSLPELYDVVELADRVQILPEIEVFKPDAAAETYERLDRGEQRGRAVVEMQGA